jgi:ATP-dependent protease ClpP protease subunit
VNTLRYIIFALLFYSTNAVALEYFAISNGDCPVYYLKLKGTIEKNDSTVFLRVLDEASLKNKNRSCVLGLQISLDSRGGDVDEAMKIGRIIRERELWTLVEFDSRCHSSCVLVLGAGVTRSPNLNIGIHRPYFVSLDKNLSTSDIQKLRKKIMSKMKVYAEEMDLSDRLIDDMMSIPPERVKILSLDELDNYRLSGTDASFDEKRTNDLAQLYGITSAELRKRDMEAERRCGRPRVDQRWTQCRQAVIWNISEAEYVRKQNMVAARCDSMPSPSRIECALKIMRDGK